MGKQRILGWSIRLVQLAAIATCLYLTTQFRTPPLASVRSILVWVMPITLLTIAAADMFLRRSRPMATARIGLSWLMLVLCAAGLTIFTVQQGQFLATKRFVLSQSTETLEQLGAHLVVGYRRQDDIDRLIEKRAIAGVFLTARNLRGKAYPEIQQSITHLQTLR
ncbi:MAG: hypothetical protein AAF808_16175, partial [Cyanobacteria bacterium P01_D01_bin.2]